MPAPKTRATPKVKAKPKAKSHAVAHAEPKAKSNAKSKKKDEREREESEAERAGPKAKPKAKVKSTKCAVEFESQVDEESGASPSTRPAPGAARKRPAAEMSKSILPKKVHFG